MFGFGGGGLGELAKSLYLDMLLTHVFVDTVVASYFQSETRQTIYELDHQPSNTSLFLPDSLASRPQRDVSIQNQVTELSIYHWKSEIIIIMLQGNGYASKHMIGAADRLCL